MFDHIAGYEIKAKMPIETTVNMDNDHHSAFNAPPPAIRLWLTLVLGITGAVFCGGQTQFLNLDFTGIKWMATGEWLAIALLGALLLRYKGRTMLPPSRIGIKPHWRPRTKKFLIHITRSLAAPYYLYASRPVGGSQHFSLMKTLTRSAFAVFPFMFAMGIAFCLEQHHFRQIGSLFFSLSIWTWTGCAALFLLSPPPFLSHNLELKQLIGADKTGVRIAAIFIIMACTLLILSYPRNIPLIILLGLMLLFFTICTLLPGPLLLLLSPTPDDPCMANRPAAAKAGPIRTIIAMTVALIPLALFAFQPFVALITGHLFEGHFTHANAGFCMDQPTIGKLLLWFTITTVTMFCFVIVAHEKSDRRVRSVWRAKLCRGERAELHRGKNG